MATNSHVTAILEALFASPDTKAEHPSSSVLVCEDVLSQASWQSFLGLVQSSQELVQSIRESANPIPVVVTSTLSPQLIRAIRTRPPHLLVLAGSVASHMSDVVASLRQIRSMFVLGPEASLDVSQGDILACAPTNQELQSLIRALRKIHGIEAFRLRLSPTPSWLAEWLTHPLLQSCSVLGYIHAQNLHSGWTRWMQSQLGAATLKHVLIPCGFESTSIDIENDTTIETAVAVHTFERTTGPIFPADKVVALISRKLDPSIKAKEDAASSPRWAQIRRAVPHLGTTAGMEHPLANLDQNPPTLAFFAQHALLCHQRRIAFLAEHSSQPLLPLQQDLITRGLEVLRNAGEVLTEHESKVVLKGFGIEITRQAVASSASGAVQYAETIGFPVVLKALSPDLRRKQELGMVLLGLSSAAAVRRGYATILNNVEEHAPQAQLDGVLVAEHVRAGIEIQCGCIRMQSGDVAIYGRAVGLPIRQEFILGLAPIRHEEALLMAQAILAQFPIPMLRRKADPNPQDLGELLIRLSDLMQQSEQRLLHVDLNPIRLVRETRAYVTLDARIVQRPHLEGV